jgi:hypothetical protein
VTGISAKVIPIQIYFWEELSVVHSGEEEIHTRFSPQIAQVRQMNTAAEIELTNPRSTLPLMEEVNK